MGRGPARARGYLPVLLLLGALLASPGCVRQYIYRFDFDRVAVHSAETSSSRADLEDDKTTVAIQFLQDSIMFSVTNKTDDLLQVEWDRIELLLASRTSRTLRPDTDLGWVAPGATASARLFPFVLPKLGEGAAYADQGLVLKVPLIVEHEPVEHHYYFVAHVQPQESEVR